MRLLRQLGRKWWSIDRQAHSPGVGWPAIISDNY